MAFQLPDDLAPEAYPLAWLIGRWRGPGFVAYPDIPQRGVLVDVEFGHDGGPYLTYRCTTHLLESPLESLEGDIDVAALQAGQVWSAESGYWRVAPTDAGTDGGGNGTPDGGVPAHALEVLLAEPSGHVNVYLGQVQGPRVELSTDLIARTSTGADIAAAARMYGLVRGELMWATDLAAFGHELQSYSSGRLQRHE
ncbi:FABP family protein [Pseudactinotalea sp. Z1739]|uniref:FABP family protein n=1 Tax=Pseudactinotalea sp. Z1739 TaxID=3413028 RepID=UPI003C7AFA16